MGARGQLPLPGRPGVLAAAAGRRGPDPAGLLGLASRIGRPAVLLPTDDAGAIFLAEHGGPLRDSFLFPDPPAELPRRLAGKYSLFQLCRDLGVPSPRATMAWSAGEAADFAATAGFPVIAKLTTPWRAAGCHDGPPLRSTTIIHDRAELAEAWLRCTEAGLRPDAAGVHARRARPGLVLPRLLRPAGRCQPAFTGVKDRSYPAYAGLTSLGHAAPNTELRDQLTGLLAALGFRGIVDLDLRFDPRDGQYKLLDFNPRLGAQFRLFEDTAGRGRGPGRLPRPDRPADAPGEPWWPAAGSWWRTTTRWARPATGAAASCGRASWAASLRRVDELAWFARDDLRPFGLMCLRMGWRAVSRPWSPGLVRAATRRGRASLSPRAAARPPSRPRTSTDLTAGFLK